MPTYNRARFIAEAVESILEQTLPPIQVLIIDDGSTDDTSELCAAFGEPVSYLRRENRGVAGARNAGIAAAEGDWIAFCDSDDLWKPHKLEVQMEVIAATKAEWC